MNITTPAALLWAKRLFKALNQPENADLSKTLSGSQTLLAKAAGCAHWHEFAQHLSESSTEKNYSSNGDGLAYYPRQYVEKAILKSLVCGDQHEDDWNVQAVYFLQAVFNATPEPFTSIEQISQAANIEYLVKAYDVPEVQHYLDTIPGLGWKQMCQAEASVQQAHLEKMKEPDSHIDTVQMMVQHRLIAWGIPLDEYDYGFQPKIPVTFDILVLCIYQDVEWSEDWEWWFESDQGFSDVIENRQNKEMEMAIRKTRKTIQLKKDRDIRKSRQVESKNTTIVN